MIKIQEKIQFDRDWNKPGTVVTTANDCNLVQCSVGYVVKKDGYDYGVYVRWDEESFLKTWGQKVPRVDDIGHGKFTVGLYRKSDLIVL